MAESEVLFTSDNSGERFCVSVWEIQTGMQIKTYKGSSCSQHTMSLLGKQYILAAQEGKPIISVWMIAKEQISQKQICPGKVTALTCSPDGNYCLVACGEKIYIWQVATGHLLAILSRHYQKINCLKFTDNGTHFLSGGNDNLVMTWDMAQVLCRSSSSSISHDQALSPVYTWSDHSLPVTDIHCGCGGMKAHVFTSSLDQTCKIYNLSSGVLLCSIVFDCSIMAVTTDPSEYNLFAGGFNGNIYQIHLYSPALKEVNHIEKSHPLIFKGHGMAVSSLSVNMDGSTLVSGSYDCTARIWHVDSKQCMRTISHKGAVTNVEIIYRPANLHDPLPKNLLPPIAPFKRHLQSQDKPSEKAETRPGDIPIVMKESFTKVAENTDSHLDILLRECGSAGQFTGKNKKPLDRQGLIQEVNVLQKANEDLYYFAVDKLLVEVKSSLEQT